MAFFDKIKTGFKTAGGAMQNAVGVVAEKNRKTALANRLRTVIRCEEKAAERAYLALGRYYYNNLRDAANADTEPYCVDIEAAEKRIENAVAKLEALNNEEPAAEEAVPEEVKELPAPAEESVPEGFVDEAVEHHVTEAAPAEKDASEDLPYAE